MRVCLLVLFVLLSNISFGQTKSKKKLAATDTVVHFYSAFKLQDGLFVTTDADSTIFPKAEMAFIVAKTSFEAANKVRVFKFASKELNQKRLPLENARAPIFFYYKTREELNAELQKLERNNKGSMFYLTEYKFDKSFRNNMISMPQVK